MNVPTTSRYNTRSSSAASSSQQSPHNQPAVPVTAPAPPPAQIKAPSTDPYLKDFTLVAEAAKRAQVAVMVRDFADCGL